MVWAVLVGWVAQMIDGTLGMGYGVTSSSVLIAVGVAPAIASASVHAAEVVVSLVSGLAHGQVGNVRRDWIDQMILPGMVGGALGAWLLASVPGERIRKPVAGVLLIMALLVIFRFVRGRRARARGLNPEGLRLVAFGAGLLDAYGGGGWGPVATPSLILSGGGKPAEAVGSVNLVEFFVTVIETCVFMVLLGAEAFRWDIVVGLLVGGLVAAPMAAWACKRLPHRLLGVLIGLALVALNAWTLAR